MNEIFDKIKEFKNADELIAAAKAKGVEIGAEQAAKLIAGSKGELSDDELNASGGNDYGCSDPSLPSATGVCASCGKAMKFDNGSFVCTSCGKSVKATSCAVCASCGSAMRLDKGNFVCTSCGKSVNLR